MSAWREMRALCLLCLVVAGCSAALMRQRAPVAPSRSLTSVGAGRQRHVITLGASTSSASASISPSTSTKVSATTTTGNRVLSFLLQYAYMAIIVAVMAQPSSLASIEASLKPQANGISLPSILTAATFATVIGKFTIPVDGIGGKRTLKVGMLLIAVLLFLQSLAPSLGIFGAIWITLCYIYSSSWGAVGKIVREEFEESRWGSELGAVAASSRLGSMLSSVVYGLVLRRSGSDWRAVFRFASAFLLSSLLLFRAVEGIDRKGTDTRDSDRRAVAAVAAVRDTALTSKEVIRKCLKSPIFWLMLCGKVLLMNIGQFISFLSLFLHSSLGISQANAATYSGIFAAGSFVSSAAGAALYQRLSKDRQLAAVAACNIVSAIICGLFAFQTVASSQFPLPVTLSLLFGLGFSWAFAFYVPPGLVCLKLGGKEHAALLTNIYDGVGFLSAAFFTYFATKKYWTSIMVFLSACSAVSCVTMGSAMALSNKQEEDAWGGGGGRR